MFQVFLPKKSKKIANICLRVAAVAGLGRPTCASMQMKTDRNVIPTFFLRVFLSRRFF